MTKYKNCQKAYCLQMKCFCCQSNKLILKLIAQKQYYECHQCGFIFISSKADKDTKNNMLSHYQNYDPHERIAASKQSFFRWSLDYLSSQLKANQRSILDVGCGFGYFLDLASRNGWNTYGVEIADSAVEAARKKLGQKNIFHGSLKNAHYPDEFFDAITLWDVLVMVDSPIEELRECYRILKPGGKLGIRLRNADFQKTIYRIYLPLSKVVSALKIKKPYVFHPHNFTQKSLELILQRGGFDNIQIINSPLTKGDPYDHTQIRMISSIMKYATDISTKILSHLSRGRLIIGPSLLAWAEKV